MNAYNSILFDPYVRKVLLVSIDFGGSKEHENQSSSFIFMVVIFVWSSFCLWVTCHSKRNHKEICHMKYKYQGENLLSKQF